MEQEEQDDGGFDLVLKELITLHEDASKSKDSNHGPVRVLKELMTQREKAAVAAQCLKQQRELMAEREKTAAERLKQKDEVALMLAKQQNDFQLQLQKQQEEFQAKLGQEKRDYQIHLEKHQVQLEKHQERLEHERQEHKHMQDKLLARQDQLLARQDELLSSQDQERKEERRQQNYFREVIQQLQEEVKVLRHNGSAHLISGTTQGEVETPGGYKTPASSSPYSMTPLSLMMETPNKPFEDSIGGGGVVENFAAGESGSVDETDNYVENDAVEEEEPTSVMEGDQGSVVSDGIQRAKGLISFEESFLLNKSDKVGNKVECAEQVSHHSSSDNLAQTSPSTKSMKLKLMKANMKMIAGKKN